ncbi:acetoin reductase [Amycolatopsis sp. NPDC051758]|uniref:acetoin reductase n=1 Tax=Amycolatopsis sp. NPDC051758 TaxID=3363935 RepID=UPI0037A97C0A
MSLAGKTALVTGAGRGIGKAIALRLAKDGANIAVNDLNPDTAKATAEEINDLGRKTVVVPGDVSDRDKIFSIVDEAFTELGSLDIMVNNAGICQTKELLEVTPQDLEDLFRVNVFGVLYGIQAAAETMKKNGGGKIINAASGAGHTGVPQFSAYSATKFGVVSFTQSAAMELAEHKITVNSYCPGIVDTDMWAELDKVLGPKLGNEPRETMTTFAQGAVLRRVEVPEDVANFVSYLAGPDSDFMTGQSVVIDGGMVMR